MDGLQPDLLGCIAGKLSGQDLGNFRLVSKDCCEGASGARGEHSWFAFNAGWDLFSLGIGQGGFFPEAQTK